MNLDKIIITTFKRDPLINFRLIKMNNFSLDDFTA